MPHLIAKFDAGPKSASRTSPENGSAEKRTRRNDLLETPLWPTCGVPTILLESLVAASQGRFMPSARMAFRHNVQYEGSKLGRWSVTSGVRPMTSAGC